MGRQAKEAQHGRIILECKLAARSSSPLVVAVYLRAEAEIEARDAQFARITAGDIRRCPGRPIERV